MVITAESLQLADTTLLLPTRRATRALQEAFLKAAGGTALLLPRIRPIIGAAEEDLSIGALAAAEEAFLTGTTRDVQPIRSVDGVPLPAAPGPVTRKAADIFAARSAETADP